MTYRQFAYVYDRLMEEMPYDDWLRFAERTWAFYGIRPRTVVDLGCGTGSLSIPLAARGYDVIGIDLSEDMLAVARDKHERDRQSRLAGQAGSLQWRLQDMREWETAEPVDAVVSFCDCLNYLTDEDDIARTFRATYAALRPGGVFAFDVHTPRQLEAYAATQPFTLDEDDIAYIWTCEYEERRLEIEHSITFFAAEPSGLFRRFEETHTQRAYPLDWLERELAAAGFSNIRVCADFFDKPPNAGTQRAFFSAVK
ncbi:methyltransferase type 12 [Gordoniibacillus kamchatkensis]|uniref:Methyltransferase type 12 n=1 Tax=Gordoniibacillus kamchatkensis TaxID=1590651 RepID=A0ABR5AAK2_9BACL|nr:class I SAM-dependent methyltransferase [Paenibacillus sp. VKM B-2647]KIL37927.1 methyltransferase type 12 [Paenibacillus sp. VKM B-2647]